MNKVIIITGISIMLSGCFGAQYAYKKEIKPDGTQTCTLMTSSIRDFEMGSIAIDKDCALTGSGQNVQNTDILKSVIEVLIEARPGE